MTDTKMAAAIHASVSDRPHETPKFKCTNWPDCGCDSYCELQHGRPSHLHAYGIDEIQAAVTAGNQRYCDDARKQSNAFKEWKAAGFPRDCPQILSGNIIDYITRSILTLHNPPIHRGSAEAETLKRTKLQDILSCVIANPQNVKEVAEEIALDWFPMVSVNSKGKMEIIVGAGRIRAALTAAPEPDGGKT
jgi:hypothetical protein